MVKRTLPPSRGWWIGYSLDAEEPRGVPKEERIHTLVVGVPGVGKSTLLLHWILQNIRDGEGVAVIDPHGDLARDVMVRIPEGRLKDVIYINPQTAKDGWVVTFNPFEATNLWEEEQRKNMFCDCLHLLYPEAWGARLEEILKYAILACYEAIPGFNLSQLWVFIRDDEYRAAALKRVTNPEVRLFWTQSWPRMRKEWLSSVETKLTHFESPGLAPMFSSATSSVDFREVMDGGKILIIHLPEGIWGKDVVNFLGSMFLTWIYLAGMSREDIPPEERRPFYIYVDEAQCFITRSLRDLLQAMRKYRVFVTLATQDIQSFAPEFRNSLPQLCDTLVSFRVGRETAEGLEAYFLRGNPYVDRAESPSRVLMNLSSFHFLCRTVMGGVPVIQTLRTVPPRPPTTDFGRVKEAARRWGERVDVGRYLRRLEEKRSKVPYPPLDPLPLLTLAKILTYEGGAPEERIIEDMHRAYGFHPRSVGMILRSLGASGYLDLEFRAETVDGRRLGRERPFVRLSRKGWETLYPPLKGARAGGAVHAVLVGRVMRWAWNSGWCPVLPDAVAEEGEGVGRKVEVTLPWGAQVEVELWPDLVIYPTSKEGEVVSERFWDTTKRFAVEVEVYPTRHPDRVLAHVHRLKELGLPVLLVVRDEADRAYVAGLLREKLGVQVTEEVSRLLGRAWEVAVRVFPSDLPAVTEDALLYRWAWDNLKDLHPEEHRRMVEANQRILEGGGEAQPQGEPVPVPAAAPEGGAPSPTPPQPVQAPQPPAPGGEPSRVGPGQEGAPEVRPGAGGGRAQPGTQVGPPGVAPAGTPGAGGAPGGARPEEAPRGTPVGVGEAPEGTRPGGEAPAEARPGGEGARAGAGRVPPGAQGEASRRGRKPPSLDEIRERVRKLKGQGYIFRKTTRRGEEVLYAYDPASWEKQWVGRLTQELKEILEALGIQL